MRPYDFMHWRLLLDGAANGARNMAIDEALLLCAAPGSAPILRFYSWNPACVSLGRFQKMRNGECGMRNEKCGLRGEGEAGWVGVGGVADEAVRGPRDWGLRII